MINSEKLLVINNKTTAVKTYIADTHSKRFLGLMGKKSFENKALLLSPCSSIHTFFMRFNIDVIFLDSQNKIIKIANNIPPWRILLPVIRAKSVLELSTQTARRLTLKTGDEISFN
ncbi:MAG: DUF192 domain-containing protein [Endomicrobiales bacterium]|nr:DUF192 domain-containing protein [Endomicrobiales bacterium]